MKAADARVLLTGASGGIGQAMARALRQAGDLQHDEQHDAQQQQMLGQHGQQHVAADHGAVPGSLDVVTSCRISREPS